MKRRSYLTGIAGLGTLGGLAQLADASEIDEFGAVDAAATTDSWDAGLPRFMQVDEKAVGTPNAPDNPVGDRLLDHPYLDFTGGTRRMPRGLTPRWLTGNDITKNTDGGTLTVEVEELAVLRVGELSALGTKVTELPDEAGDDDGPGTYTYPTSGDFGTADFDIGGVTVRDAGSAWQFEVAIEGEIRNPFGLPEGFSHQFLQFYVHDPDASGGSTVGRTGTNVTFEDPYQYRVLANGQEGAWVEDSAGNTVADGRVSANTAEDTLLVEFPKDALSADLTSLYVAPLVFGFDGFGTGGIRAVKETAESYAFGGAQNSNAPSVIDMVTPPGISQSQALSYSSSSKATVPYSAIQTASYEREAVFEDETGDNDGPGSYTLPTNAAFYDGVWDVDTLTVSKSTSRVRFEFQMASEVQNPFSLPRGFSHEFFQVYVHDPEAGSDQPASHTGRTGSNVLTEAPYHYRVYVDGNTQVAERADGSQIASELGASADAASGKISFRVPKSAIGGDLSNKKIALMLFGHDGFGPGGIRPVTGTAQTWRFGGARNENAPNVVDLLSPYSVLDQSEALSYSASSKATVPLMDVSARGRKPPENKRRTGRDEDTPGESKHQKGRGENTGNGKRGQGRGTGNDGSNEGDDSSRSSSRNGGTSTNQRGQS